MMMFYLIEKNEYLENVGQFVSWMYEQQGRLLERMKAYTYHWRRQNNTFTESSCASDRCMISFAAWIV